MKASQAISSEIVLDQLWTITMRIMLENAGGQRGCFVVRKDGQLFIEGLTEVGLDTTSPARSILFEDAEGALALPTSIIYRVLHTNNDRSAIRAGRAILPRTPICFAKPQSVLCIPLVRHGKFEGASHGEQPRIRRLHRGQYQVSSSCSTGFDLRRKCQAL
jgi:hypothetical protein